MKTPLFHADDWGLSPAINEGILELIRNDSLCSASCMANVPFLSHGVEELREFALRGGQVYLHFNLTYGSSLSSGVRFLSHKRLMINSVLGRISADEIKREVRAQLHALARLKIPIAGVNGHHHVHVLPGVSRPLQEVMLEKGIKKFLVLDDPEHWPSYMQTHFHQRWGVKLDQIKIVKCSYLRAKNLRSKKDFQRKVAAGHLPLLVHPALWNDFAETGMTDPLQDQRVQELKTVIEYLNA